MSTLEERVAGLENQVGRLEQKETHSGASYDFSGTTIADFLRQCGLPHDERAVKVFWHGDWAREPVVSTEPSKESLERAREVCKVLIPMQHPMIVPEVIARAIDEAVAEDRERVDWWREQNRGRGREISTLRAELEATKKELEGRAAHKCWVTRTNLTRLVEAVEALPKWAGGEFPPGTDDRQAIKNEMITALRTALKEAKQ